MAQSSEACIEYLEAQVLRPGSRGGFTNSGFHINVFMRLVHGNCNRYDSRKPVGLADFQVIRPSTTRFVRSSGTGCRLGCAGRVVLAPLALARSTSVVELRLRRSPGRVDVVIAGLGTEVRAVSQASRMIAGRRG